MLNRAAAARWILTFILALAASPIVFADEKDDRKAIQDFNAAAALQNQGLFDRAANNWREFIKKYPGDKRLDRALYYLGYCELRDKKFAEASDTFQSLLDKHRQSDRRAAAQFYQGMAHYELALASQQADDFRRAAEALAKAAADDKSPYIHKALYYQGDALWSAGDPKSAVAAYRTLVEKHSDGPMLARAVYDLGTAQQELGLDQDATATFQEFLANKSFAGHPLADEVTLRLGTLLAAEQKYPEAEKLLASVATKKGFEQADLALLRLGECQLNQDRHDDAAKTLDEMLKNHADSPYAPVAAVAAGKAHFLRNDMKSARSRLEKVGPSSAEAAYWLGRTLLSEGDAKQAAAILERAAGEHRAGPFVPYLQMARIDALYELPDRRKETASLYEDFAKAHPDHPLAAQARYMTALAKLERQDFAAARSEAEALLGKLGADTQLRPALLYIAAESYLLSSEGDGRDLNKAAERYRELAEKFPDHPRAARARLRIGWTLYKAEKFADAAKHLQQVKGELKTPELRAEANLLLGRSLAADGKHNEAIPAFDEALKAKGDWDRVDEVLVAAAESLRREKNTRKAADYLRRLNSSHADSAYRDRALFLLGDIATDEGTPTDAAKFYGELVEKFPDSEFTTPALYGLAATWYAQGDDQQALDALNRLLSGKSATSVTSRARYLRGLVHQRMKNYSAAIGDLNEFLTGDPDTKESIDARYALALCYIGDGKLDEATAALQTLINDAPGYAHADDLYYELGHALLGQEQPSEAAEVFAHLAENYPNSPLAAESWFHVGAARESALDAIEDEAAQASALANVLAAYESGLKKVDDASLRAKLSYKTGDILFRQQKYSEAVEQFKQLLSDSSSDALAGPARFLAGEALFRQDKFDEALPLLEQVVKDRVEPYYVQALYRAGAAASELKRWDQSEQHYAKLLEESSDFPQAADARYGLALAIHNQAGTDAKKLDRAANLYAAVTDATDGETAAKARFMIGEIAFVRKQYGAAVEHFLRVSTGYPYPEWQSLAQLETARCLIELDRKPQAVAALKKFLADYPDHPKKPAAEKLLAELQE